MRSPGHPRKTSHPERALARLRRAALALGAIVLVSLPDVPLRACGSGLPPFELVKEWPRDSYLLLLAGSASPDAFSATREAVAALSGKVNLRLVEIAPEKGSGPPTAALVSPRGRVVAKFASPPGREVLKKYYRSPVRDAIARGLREKAAVVVVYGGPGAPHREENAKIAREAIAAASELFSPSASLLFLDSAAAAEQELVLNLGIPSGREAEGFFVVFAHGRTLPAVPGPVRKNDVLDRLQYLFSDTGCVAPFEFEEDLLLEW